MENKKGRPPKTDSQMASFRLSRDVLDAIDEMMSETRMSKTAIVENAVLKYVSEWKDSRYI